MKGNETMKRETAAQIATDLIDGGINARYTTKLTAEAHSVSIETVRKIRRTLLRMGSDDMSICSMADAIANGWEDQNLNLN
jgi:hypothetical protein